MEFLELVRCPYGVLVPVRQRTLPRDLRKTRVLLAKMTAPALVIWGERDRFLSRPVPYRL